ncbi:MULTISPECIES: class I SAM-dependent DNA methyltransferase [Psychrilyobacter]|nr:MULTISPECIES: class I SAM-dependent methyltransferase [Psychrilyobacter]MCS5420249.1 methyltransferase domain-containing protein [Psychrilyobacter sp. S5]NDI77274.1 methyltransferase domain-containing protein [Psychrilyobacter piezotolerans]
MSNFNERAKDWDTESKIERGKAIARAIKNNIKLNKNMNILDFGCGTGLLIFPLIEEVGAVHGIDLSPNMLDILKEKGRDYKNLTTEPKGIFEITSTFDLIMSSMVMHHIEDITNLAKKLYDSLNPNGMIAIADLMEEDGSFHDSMDGIYSLGFSNEFLEKIFKGAGFKEVKVIENIFIIEKNNKKYPLFLVIGTK